MYLPLRDEYRRPKDYTHLFRARTEELATRVFGVPRDEEYITLHTFLLRAPRWTEGEVIDLFGEVFKINRDDSRLVIPEIVIPKFDENLSIEYELFLVPEEEASEFPEYVNENGVVLPIRRPTWAYHLIWKDKDAPRDGGWILIPDSFYREYNLKQFVNRFGPLPRAVRYVLEVKMPKKKSKKRKKKEAAL